MAETENGHGWAGSITTRTGSSGAVGPGTAVTPSESVRSYVPVSLMLRSSITMV